MSGRGSTYFDPVDDLAALWSDGFGRSGARMAGSLSSYGDGDRDRGKLTRDGWGGKDTDENGSGYGSGLGFGYGHGDGHGDCDGRADYDDLLYLTADEERRLLAVETLEGV